MQLILAINRSIYGIQFALRLDRGDCIEAKLNKQKQWEPTKMTPLRKMIAAFGFLAILISPLKAETVGEVDVDWLGNDIIIEAIEDPKVKGVTCHVSYFERGLIDRLQKGNWFEDPSNSSIACRQTGPIEIGDIDRSEEGESVFSQRTSLILKALKVTHIFDAKNNTLIYLAHARAIQDGSAKMSISTVPLYQPHNNQPASTTQ